MLDKELLEGIEDLRADNRSGASELIQKALKVFKVLLFLTENEEEDIRAPTIEICKLIIEARPSMAPIINTVGFIIHDLDRITKQTLSNKLKELERENSRRYGELEKSFKSFISSFNKKSLGIMLISYSSTLIGLLLKAANPNHKLYILESRPLYEGQRVVELLSEKYECHLIIDAAMGAFMDKIDLVLLGVDSVLRDGAIVNKIGSYPLACIARANDKDVYAVCDSFKYNLNSLYGKDIIIEEKNPEEVASFSSKNSNIHVHNYYFDITPQKYLSGAISNYGYISMNEFLKRAQKELSTKWYERYI